MGKHSSAQGKPFDVSQGKLVLIIGPSGVGKSVILKKLRAAHPQLHFPRSATTRARRQGEGNDLYHFVNDAQFDKLLADGKILEWALVHGGARYGTMLEEIVPPIERGKTVVREVDVQGFINLQGDARFSGENPPYRMESIFILPESVQQMVDHIQKRAPMKDEELKRRLKSMEKELDYAVQCTFTVLNKEGKLDDTYKQVEKFILGS
jgi:guanylate kinase